MWPSRRSYQKATLGQVRPGGDSRRRPSIPPVCVNVSLSGGSHDLNGAVGETITPYTIPVLAGTAPLLFTIVNGELAPDLIINSATGQITGTLSLGGNYTGTVRVSNGCPSEAFYDINSEIAAAPPSPLLMRTGVFVMDDFPTAPPTFVDTDFTGSNADFHLMSQGSPVSRNNTYVFTPFDLGRPIFWFADSLMTGTPSFKQGGLDIIFKGPSSTGAGVIWQSLTIVGVPGKVLITVYPQSGGMTAVVT